MPLYEYHCQGCGKNFDKMQPYESRDLVSCPDCGSRVDRKISLFTHYWKNPFTKDGPGFESVVYSKEEARERIKANAGKYD